MGEWKTYRLGEIATFKYGTLPPKNSNIGQYPIWSGYRYVGYTNTFNCPKNSIIVIARGVGGTGNVKIAKEDCFLTNLSIIVNIDTSICNPYYFYYQYLLSNLKYLDSGSAQSQITIEDLKRLNIKLPSPILQNRTVEILKSLDDKIELNRRINANLEAQAQALFRSWFVDFEPFRDGPFVDSQLGKIPQGWKVGNLLDIAELFDYKRKPLSSREREKMQKIYPYYGATSIMDFVDNYIFDGIYLLMGEDGSVANAHGYPYLQYVFGKFWPNNHAHVMQGKNGYTTEMLHCLLLKKNITSIVTGAVQPKISQANMKKILVPLPPDKVCSAFADLINPIYSTRRNSEKEISNLSALRDTLLPKLTAGEIKI